MEIKILREAGYEETMLGLSLSYNKPVCDMTSVAKKLLGVGGSHLKYLESMQIWLDIDAARYFWQEFDTYRVGVTKQSGSTMHTITKNYLIQKDFEMDISEVMLQYLNFCIKSYNAEKINNNIVGVEQWFSRIKNNLPEGFLQRRIINTNYKVLRHIIRQRKNHRLDEWQKLCKYLQENCKYKEFLI